MTKLQAKEAHVCDDLRCWCQQTQENILDFIGDAKVEDAALCADYLSLSDVLGSRQYSRHGAAQQQELLYCSPASPPSYSLAVPCLPTVFQNLPGANMKSRTCAVVLMVLQEPI